MMQTVTIQPDRPRNPSTVVLIILIGLLVISLTLGAVLEGDQAAAPTIAATPTPTEAEKSPTAVLTDTAGPATPALESTPTAPATAIETPSPTATPPREPIVHSGSGDSVFYPQKWIGPAVVRVSHDGAGPLTVWTQNDNAEREDMLVNVVGPYRGNSVIDLLGIQRILRFEVRTADAWTIEVLPLGAAMHLTIPGAIQGAGDDVVVIEGPFPPDLLSVDAPAVTGEFTVLAYGTQQDRVIDAVGPYNGTVSIPRDTTVLAVKAVGQWRLEITTR
jgi:hypothetical protein